MAWALVRNGGMATCYCGARSAARIAESIKPHGASIAVPNKRKSKGRGETAGTSDSSDNKDPPDPLDFELMVGNLLASLLIYEQAAPIEIHHRRKYPGKRSGHEHEIDLSFSTEVAGTTVLVLVECKAYRRRVPIEDVLAFAERIDDIDAHKGILVTLRGFQPGAERIAKARGIALVVAVPGKSRFRYMQRFFPDPREVKAVHNTIYEIAGAFSVPPEQLANEADRLWQNSGSSLLKDDQPELPRVSPLDFGFMVTRRGVQRHHGPVLSVDFVKFGAILVASSVQLAREINERSWYY